jgi:protein-S-isoprenylcysteine O-methyltransferase Ste14
MPQIIFFTIFIFGPIPTIHIFLHLFLKFWRKHPLCFYLCGAAVWTTLIPIALFFSKKTSVVFTAPVWLVIIARLTAFCALFLILWSINNLSPKKFFLWAVLKPDSIKQERIAAGPYRFFPHPAYTAYAAIVIMAFLATGYTALLFFGAIFITLILIVIMLENHELSLRLKK